MWGSSLLPFPVTDAVWFIPSRNSHYVMPTSFFSLCLHLFSVLFSQTLTWNNKEALQLWNEKNNRVLLSSLLAWRSFVSFPGIPQLDVVAAAVIVALSLSFSGAKQHYTFNGWLVSDIWPLPPGPQLWEIVMLVAPDGLSLEFPPM